MTILAGNPQTGLLFSPPLDILGGIVNVYNFWGLVLSPAYLLWGPSDVYARISLAALGVLAVWNVFTLGRFLRSRWVGLLAAVPIAVYPSFVLVESTVLRESAVLFLLTSVVRLAIGPSSLSQARRIALCGAGLIMLPLLRWELWILEALAISAAAVVYLDARTDGDVRDRLHTHWVGTSALSIAFLYGIWQVSKRAARYLSFLHSERAVGRTAYLASVTFRQPLRMFAFAPVAVVYFLFTPFPWMVGTAADVVVAAEALGNVAFTVAAVRGIRSLLAHQLDWRVSTGWVALGVWVITGSILFGLGTANVGTAVRHRQMFIWVVYLFGAVGIVEWFSSYLLDSKVLY
ncbi:hypothetical protein [Halococcus qingdaonensis]|uniref:hypothetical protein n=1 Tax=Halococcus qingdaonensis TaxID=224402 RepID=UPI002116CA48|nr:hypothetical protein [Halococcus qingdaonensis]